MTGPARTIALLGLRGSGKSTVGRRLAGRLGLGFVDLDDLIPPRLGERTVADVFRNHGEPAFRAAERDALEGALAEPGRVLALGGGTPTAPGAEPLLREAARRGTPLLYLRASPETLRARLSRDDDRSRPSLTGAGTIAEVESVFDIRDPLYRDLATLVLDTDGMSVDAIVDAAAELVAP